MIEVRIVIDQPKPNEEKLPVVIDAITRFVYSQFPELNTNMQSPIKVSLKVVSENEHEEGIL